MFLDSNAHCVLCMECVRNCPNGSPQLNLRAPARELWTSTSELAKKGWFTVMLLGLLIGLIFLQSWENGSSGWASEMLSNYRAAIGTVVLGSCVGIPLSILWILKRRLHSNPSIESEARFWKGIVALVPLVVAGYASYEIGFVPELINFEAGLSYQAQNGGGGPAFSLSLLALSRIIILAFGFLITIGVLWKHYHEETQENRHHIGVRGFAVKVALSTAYCAAILALMLETL